MSASLLTANMYNGFFFNDTATTEIYTLSLHDALPISHQLRAAHARRDPEPRHGLGHGCYHRAGRRDRKSTRLNSSHGYISYAVFCLKKKKKPTKPLALSKIKTQEH